MTIDKVLKPIVTGLLLVAYAVTSHLALTQHWLWMAFALAMSPLLLMAIAYVLKRLYLADKAPFSKTILLLATLLGVMGLLNYWANLMQFTEWMFLIQNVGTNAALGVMFAMTLLPNKKPLVTQFASILHAECPADMQRYTRQVTWAWVWFFGAMCTISLGLFFVGPLSWWSAFINLLTWPLVGVMFVTEFAFRRWRHPHFEKVTLIQGLMAFTNHYTKPSGLAGKHLL
jgi:uncharacterized membrane protein